MTVHYAGKLEPLAQEQKRKLDERYSKLGKLLGRHDSQTAHVFFGAQRHVKKADIKVHYLERELVGHGTGPDQLTALLDGLDKLEKQVLKSSDRQRAVKRATPDKFSVLQVPNFDPEGEPTGRRVKRKVFEVEPPRQKPMTLEEAILALGPGTHLIYRDAASERTHVLIRRADGHFDLAGLER